MLLGNDFAGTHGVAPALTNGANGTKKPPPSVISNQLRDELIRILTTGDPKNDGAFTVAIAAQVEKFVVAAREILMTESMAQNDLASLMMMRKQHMGMGGVYPYSLTTSLGDSGGYLPPVNNENFGVQAVRQVVEAIRTVGESPAKLVEALAAARANGLTDVVTVLEKKLGVAKAEPDSDAEGSAGLRPVDNGQPIGPGDLQ